MVAAPIRQAEPMTDRRIVLLRHAKTERSGGGSDIERPLTARGRADAMAVGAWLAHAGLRPDLVICSPSIRTRATWQEVAGLLAGVGDRDPDVRYEPVVYGGAATRLLELIRSADSDATTVLLIGHNPTISELSDLLDIPRDGSDPDPGGEAVGGGYGLPGGGYGLRTAGLVVHRVGGDWAELEPGTAPVLARHTARG
jgi:phosphohistidine phosphatase